MTNKKIDDDAKDLLMDLMVEGYKDKKDLGPSELLSLTRCSYARILETPDIMVEGNNRKIQGRAFCLLFSSVLISSHRQTHEKRGQC